MRKLLNLLLLLPVLFACSKTDAGVTFSLSFDRSLPDYKTVNVPTKADGHTVRHFVNVYKVTDAGEVVNQTAPVYHYAWDGDSDTYETTIPAGRYRVMAWSDYVLDGSPATYWNASDFTNIRMANTHAGSNEYIRAYKGQADLTVSAEGSVTATIPMASPMGKFVVLSTEKQTSLPQGLRVRFSYTQFMPSGFGMFFDKPTDSQAGVKFESTPQLNADGTVLLGFDYVLTNGSESQVPILMELLDANGNAGSTFSFTVPLVRGKVTTVSGEFLTGASQGAVVINSDFEGNLNYKL